MRAGSIVLTAMTGLFLSACGRSESVESKGHHVDSTSAQATRRAQPPDHQDHSADHTARHDPHHSDGHGKHHAGNHLPTAGTVTATVDTSAPPHHDTPRHGQQTAQPRADSSSSEALQIFRRRILPILQAKNP